jgi:hypothetical protein
MLLFYQSASLKAPAAERVSVAPAATSSVSIPSVMASWGWGKMSLFLGDRKRMFQLATLGMCLGLYILMRK